MDINLIKQVLSSLPDVDVSKIESALAEADLETIVSDIKKDITFSVWDKVTPINGADPKVLLSTVPHCLEGWTGLTGLVKVGDFFSHVISHDFNSDGWTPVETEKDLKELSLPIIEKAIFYKTVEYFITKIFPKEGEV